MQVRKIYVVCSETKKKLDEYKVSLDTYYNKLNKETVLQPSTKTKIVPNTELKKKYYETYERLYAYVKNNLGTIRYFMDTIFNMRNLLDKRNFTDISALKNEFYNLLEKVNCAISLLVTISSRSEEDLGLEIKLPDLNDITELKKHINSLEFVFTKCPFFQSDDASLKLETAENGSIVLIFGVVCASVSVGSKFLNNIASFIDKCFVIKSHSLSCKRQKQEIENAEIEQKEKEELLKNINRLYRISVENAIRDMQVTTGCYIKDGDEKGRAEQSLEKMTKLLEQGLQIYASLDSPQEVKALFEPLEMHYLSTEKELKKIEKKSETDSE